MDAEAARLPPTSVVDRSALEAWLRSEAVGAEGEVWSWVSPQGPGYAYPEAAGLWLTCLGPDERVARWLCAQVRDDGAVGRSGIDYLFDTAMALNGLLVHAERGGHLDGAVPARLFGFIADCVERRVACRGEIAERRWSTEWSPHLLKAVIAIDRWARHTGEPRAAALSRRLVEDFAARDRNGFFPAAPDAASVYLHASCYAVEALLHLKDSGALEGSGVLRASGDALALVQSPAGGLPAWSGADGAGATRADATAQAIRIWCAVDAARFGANVERALCALAALQTSDGAILYESGSDHRNTWAGLFTWQALGWAEQGAQVGWLA